MSKNTLLSELINYISANSSGNVVVAAPSSGYALDVTGTGRFTGALTGTSASFATNASSTSLTLEVSNAGTYGLIGIRRGTQTSASAGINYYTTTSQKWFSGIYESTDNFGFYSVGTNGFPLILNYSTGAATFSGSVGAVNYIASGTESFRTYSDNGYISFYNSANTTRQGYLQIQSTALTLSAEGASAFIALNAGGGNEKMRITSGGNVGIGTTSTSGRLHIVNASGSGQPVLELQQSNSGSNILQWKGSAGTYLGVIQNDGNVGIGTTSPNSSLAISISAFSNAGTKGYTTDNTAGISAYVNSQDPYTGYLDIYATRSGNDGTLGGSVIRFLNQTVSSTASAIERMRIATDGRVGIGTGTSAPPEPLSVSFAAHGLISQHRQSNGIGVGQNFYMKFNTANGTAAAYAGIYADIQSNTDGAQTGRMILQAANAGSLVSALVISNNGTISRPNQPLAMGALASDQSISANTFTTIAFLTSQGFYGVNTNNCWNNSSYGFTAPVAGTYLVTLSIYTNTLGQVALHVNGVRKHSIPSGYFPAGSNTWGGSAMIPLSAGEVLTLQGYGGTSGVVYANQYHTWFGIYLM